MDFWLPLRRGIAAGSLAYGPSFIHELLIHCFPLVKSIPVASFVILALIWIGSENLSVFIAFLVVVPMIYSSTLAGLKSADRRLLEMARVFSMPFWKRLRFIYIPAVLPYLMSGCRTALGMSWKSGIAAGGHRHPGQSIGEQLYYAKLYLDTAGLFAWTFVIILASSAFEALFLWLLDGSAADPAADFYRKEADTCSWKLLFVISPNPMEGRPVLSGLNMTFTSPVPLLSHEPFRQRKDHPLPHPHGA